MKMVLRMVLGLAAFLGFIILYNWIFKGAGFFWIYADLAAFLGLILLTAVINRISYSFREEWLFFRLALNGNLQTERDMFTKGILFFKHQGKIVLSVAAAMSVWSVISMMVNLEDPSAIGPNLATALLVLLYGVLGNLFLIHPCEMELKKKLLNLEAGE